MPLDKFIIALSVLVGLNILTLTGFITMVVIYSNARKTKERGVADGIELQETGLPTAVGNNVGGESPTLDTQTQEQ